MKDKINIAKLLEDCPKGMEFDCILFNSPIALEGVADESTYPIRAVSKDGFHHAFTKYGTLYKHDDAKCVIFPKGKTTWEGFHRPFKDGDIVFYDNCVSIFKEWGDETLFRNYVKVDIDGRHHMLCDRTHSNGKGIKREARFATEEEKEKLFQAIKDNGYKWNAESKSLEKLIESKEDTDNGLVMSKEDRHDEVVMSGIYFDRENYADEVELHLGNYEIEVRDGKTYAIFKNQETKTLKPKFKVGDKIKTKVGTSTTIETKSEKLTIIEIKSDGYILGEVSGEFSVLPFVEEDYWELVPDKFDINTLVPFESRVLIRDHESQKWNPAIWGTYDNDPYYPYRLIGTISHCCIPYEGNEHLLGTTNDCNEFYKTWVTI